MRVTVATEADSDRLSQFFGENPLPGNLQLAINRTNNYFSKYKLFSNDYQTLMIVDDQNKIHAAATLIFIPAVLEQKVQTIGFATDLRISKSREALMAWSNNFLPKLLEAREQRNCKYFFSPIGRSRIDAFKSFIRPRSISRNFPRYHLFRKFEIVTLHGLYPWATEPLTTINIHPATENDIDELQEYIKYNQQLRPMYFPQKHENLLKTIESWPGLSIHDFLLAKDNEKNIIGCMALWDGKNIEEIIAVGKSKRVVTFEQTLKALSYLRITRPLIKKNSDLLHYKQINFLYANNPDIFYTMLRSAYSQTPKDHFLAYIRFENQLTYLPARSFISQAVPYNLYCLLAPSDPVPHFLKPTFLEMAPDIDLALI